MFTHILIASDGSQLADKAVTQGLDVAKALKAKVLVATVTEPWTEIGGACSTSPSVVQEYEQGAGEGARRIAFSICEAAKTREVACSTLHVWGKHPAEGILDAARKNDCDLIVMASHGRRGLGRILLGSVAQEILVRSTIPVLICC